MAEVGANRRLSRASRCARILRVAEGVVKWYDRRRREGFLLRSEGPDVHVPESALLDPEPGFLVEGQAVEFELVKISGGFRARAVRVRDPEAPTGLGADPGWESR